MTIAGASAIVLAGGRGSRMGRPKATLRFGNVTLLDLIVGRLRKSFDEIVIVAGPPENAGLVLADPGAATIVHDSSSFEGPLQAVKHGLEEVKGDPVFACSCDLPMLSRATVEGLFAFLDNYDAVIPEVGGMPQPLHAVYRKRCVGAIDKLSALGEKRLVALADAIRVRKLGEHHLRLLDPGLMSFYNINTPDQYVAALQMGGFPYRGEFVDAAAE